MDARNTIETAVVANIWSSIQGVQLEIGEIQFRPFGLKKSMKASVKQKFSRVFGLWLILATMTMANIWSSIQGVQLVTLILAKKECQNSQ